MSDAANLTAYVRDVFPTLDRRSYYDLLQITRHADLAAVRAAYYHAAGWLHPDRTLGRADAETRERLEIVYARITEAYRVLSTPEKRAAYDRGLGVGKLRLVTTERESRGPTSPEDALKHPEAKKFFRLALMCIARADWKGAVMNLNFARTFEPGAAIIGEKLAEAQAALKAGGAPKRP